MYTLDTKYRHAKIHMSLSMREAESENSYKIVTNSLNSNEIHSNRTAPRKNFDVY